MHLRRPAARAGLERHRACSRPRPKAPTSAWSTRPLDAIAHRREGAGRARSCSSPSASRRRRRRPRWRSAPPRRRASTNFSVLCNHVLTPAAIQTSSRAPRCASWAACAIDGFIGPAHVSTVIGTAALPRSSPRNSRSRWSSPASSRSTSLQAILMLVRQINEGRHEVENQYIRAVSRNGNEKAQAEVAEVFELRRALRMARPRRRALQRAEAARRLRAFRRRAALRPRRRSRRDDNPACECGAILRGVKKPRDCKLFGTALHARHADGLVHGVARGRLLGALDLRPLPRGGRSRARRRAAHAEQSRERAAADPPQARRQERPRRPVARRRRARDGAIDRGHLSRRLRQRLAARRQRPVGASTSPPGAW